MPAVEGVVSGAVLVEGSAGVVGATVLEGSVVAGAGVAVLAVFSLVLLLEFSTVVVVSVAEVVFSVVAGETGAGIVFSAVLVLLVVVVAGAGAVCSVFSVVVLVVVLVAALFVAGVLSSVLPEPELPEQAVSAKVATVIKDNFFNMSRDP